MRLGANKAFYSGIRSPFLLHWQHDQIIKRTSFIPVEQALPLARDRFNVYVLPSMESEASW